MTKHVPTSDDLSTVETELWNVIRSIEAMEELATQVASMSNAEVNALAEGIAGIAAVTVSHVRRQQIALGGAE